MLLAIPPLSPVICRPHAAPTERFRAFMAREAVVNRLCPGRHEDLIERLREEIAKRQISVAVKAARHHRAVAKNADLITQSVAEDVGVGGISGKGRIWPFKALAPFKKDFGGESVAVVLLCPLPLIREGGI